MIRITQMKLPVDHGSDALMKKITHILRVSRDEIERVQIVRQSLDARKKPELYLVYSVDVSLKGIREEKIWKKVNNKNVTLTDEKGYDFAPEGKVNPAFRPVVVGSGPAGLFCAWLLARHGFAPQILERGDKVEERIRKVNAFWESGILDEESNVQFGEGGAGTFSDGKLNTTVKDPRGRNRKVLELFVQAGAPEEILWQQKPHLGTDQLISIVRNLRRSIEEMGGRFFFGTKMTDIACGKGRITAIEVNNKEWLPADALVLAIGHSARDTFQMLYDRGVPMSAKSFAAGIRIEHPQTMINLSQYGREQAPRLGAAPYKLTHQTKDGRGVYSFCMCPGGYVVNASSEPGRLAVNGMSYHGRAGKNANSALIITVTPEDFPEDSPLGGVAFQRSLEEKAYDLGQGKIPVELYGDFKEGRTPGEAFGQVEPQFKGAYAFADLRRLLGPELSGVMVEAIQSFGEKIQGFDRPDSILAGIESRTSSPVRIPRDSQMESQIRGLYPCGEGAGYAGGITSAAMDGLKTAEALIRRFAPSAAAGIDGEDLSL